MAEIISIENQKGGCGKTTTAVNLSAGLALFGMKTLLVDMDPQGNASMTYGVNIEDIPISMADVLLDPEIEMKYNIFNKGSIHIAPSNPTLNYAEERLHTMKGKVTRLKEKLREVEGYYDYIVIDCPPNIGILTTNALMASKWVIVPVDMGFYSLVGIRQLLARVEEVGAIHESSLQIRILLTMFDEKNTLSWQIKEKVADAFKDRMFKTAIRRDVRLAEAPSHLKSVFEYDWEGEGAEDYLNLAREVLLKRGVLNGRS
ncbi:MAG: ParA family protein [Deltaproteobacteria bacterium]